MTKQEFLNSLRISLNGKISPVEVEENISYYEDYINTQVRMGQSEQEVLALLGEPRLIARSVIEVSGKERENQEEYHYEETQSATDKGKRKGFHMPIWLWIFLIVFVICLILGAVFSIVWALLPILIPVGIVIWIIKVVRKKQ